LQDLLKKPIQGFVHAVLPRYNSLAHNLAQLLAAQAAHWPLWIPVLLGLGIGLNFGITAFKMRLVLFVSLLMLACLSLLVHRLWGVAFLLVAFGLGWTEYYAYQKATPTLHHPLERADITGRLVLWERLSATRVRMELADVRFERTHAVGLNVPTLRRIRLLVHTSTPHPPAIGVWIAARVRLVPPPEPAMPGGYDFARAAWFSGLGGVGSMLGGYRVVVPQAGPAVQTASHWQDWFTKTRLESAARLRAHTHGAAGEILVAMVIGDRAALTDNTAQALRTAGLQHLLSISGFHLAVVAGGIFLLVRKSLCLIPTLALHWPLKAIAAVVAALVAVFYTLLTGGALPTWRSCITVLIIALAVLLGRRPFSLRFVAAGATLILLWTPAALVNISFQLSFAAITALIAMVEAGGPLFGWRNALNEQGYWGTFLGFVLSLLITTLVAEISLAPFLIYHFQQIGVYGLVANMLAVPLCSFIILPFGLLGLLLDPLGLAGLPLGLAGLACTWMLEIATWVAGLPASLQHVPSWPPGVLLCWVAAGLLLTLGQGPVRWFALLPFGLAVVLLLQHQRPDIRLSGQGKLIGIELPHGVALSDGRTARFTARVWVQDAGALYGWTWQELGMLGHNSPLCGQTRCIATFEHHGTLWRIALDGWRAPHTCPQAEIWVSPYRAVAGHCPILTFDRLWFAAHGATDLFLSKPISSKSGAQEPALVSVRITTVRSTRGEHPWVPHTKS
jgi:competence protein ComEC